MPPVNQDDVTLATAAAQDLLWCKAPLTMVLRPLSAVHLAAVLQLALRHPSVTAASADVAHTFLAHVRTYFRDHDATAVLEMLRRGDDPAEDR